jgi:hypothetical protein
MCPKLYPFSTLLWLLQPTRSVETTTLQLPAKPVLKKTKTLCGPWWSCSVVRLVVLVQWWNLHEHSSIVADCVSRKKQCKRPRVFLLVLVVKWSKPKQNIRHGCLALSNHIRYDASTLLTYESRRGNILLSLLLEFPPLLSNDLYSSDG